MGEEDEVKMTEADKKDVSIFQVGVNKHACSSWKNSEKNLTNTKTT